MKTIAYVKSRASLLSGDIYLLEKNYVFSQIEISQYSPLNSQIFRSILFDISYYN